MKTRECVCPTADNSWSSGNICYLRVTITQPAFKKEVAAPSNSQQGSRTGLPRSARGAHLHPAALMALDVVHFLTRT